MFADTRKPTPERSAKRPRRNTLDITGNGHYDGAESSSTKETTNPRCQGSRSKESFVSIPHGAPRRCSVINDTARHLQSRALKSCDNQDTVLGSPEISRSIQKGSPKLDSPQPSYDGLPIIRGSWRQGGLTREPVSLYLNPQPSGQDPRTATPSTPQKKPAPHPPGNSQRFTQYNLAMLPAAPPRQDLRKFDTPSGRAKRQLEQLQSSYDSPPPLHTSSSPLPRTKVPYPPQAPQIKWPPAERYYRQFSNHCLPSPQPQHVISPGRLDPNIVPLPVEAPQPQPQGPNPLGPLAAQQDERHKRQLEQKMRLRQEFPKSDARSALPIQASRLSQAYLRLMTEKGYKRDS
ncbi:uncharacterized protein BP5553_01013 [Venustampulla echinocandica]|uniref:Uncharacterized protein n=1 Tax=Venustampulla echinocandica TaxID=2656787 RepID=A0A370TZS7_9HELO|nr:uncharacterized protein BP5553_01013 [Venustampulla echinocandica]RDL41034.1 hypothetical protein BP5553_01013 [Venustampulla echinocandica]